MAKCRPNKAFFFALIFLLYENLQAATKKECRIYVSDIDEDSPVILQHKYRNGKSPFHHLTGSGNDYIAFSAGDGVRFACPDSDSNKLVIPNLPRMSFETIAYCVEGSTFSISATPYKFSEIRCEKPPQSTVKEEGKCDIGTGGKKLNIGFKLQRKFFGIVQVCYNPVKHTTLNAMHLVSRNIGARETDNTRSSYFSASNFGKDLAQPPDTFYACKRQLDTFTQLLGSKAQANKYLMCGSYYLTRGHLAPNADFMFGYQQKATFYYINTTPQWHTINSGNWKILENAVRRYASDMDSDLTVVTGTLNVASLPDIRASEKPLYMTTDIEDKPTVPVPALIWKLVVDKARYNGIVFVVVNDPLHPNVSKQGYVICKDVCDKTTSWFNGWDRFKVSRGYVYCCSVNDFSTRTGIKIPFKVKNLLS